MTSKKRVFIQVDGSNFYHRLKEHPVRLENLLQFDFAKFAHFLANGGKVVEAIYYVGRVRAKPNDKKAMHMMGNQQRLLARLRNQGWATSVGFILETDGKHHEKGVDVKIAVDIVGFSHAPSHAMIEYATETRLLRKDDLVPFVVEKAEKK